MSDREFGRTVADAIRLAARAQCVFLEVRTGTNEHEYIDFLISCQEFVGNIGWKRLDDDLPSMLDTYDGWTFLVVGSRHAIARVAGRRS